MRAKLNLLAYQIWRALKREEGQDLIEYALLVALIALAVAASLGPVGGIMQKYYADINKILAPYL